MLWLVVSLQTIKVRNLTEVKNFVWQRVRKFFKFENPTPVQTPATLDPTEIYPWFYLRNYHADSCTAKIENWLRIRTRFFTNFWHRHWFGKKNEESRRSTLRHSGPWQKWSTPARSSVFLLNPDPDPESKICEKPDPESLFSFGSSRNLCGNSSSKNMGKLRLDRWM